MIYKKAVRWIALSFVFIALAGCALHNKEIDDNNSSNVDKVVLHCPNNERTRAYTFPGPAITYTCCAPNDFPSELQAKSINGSSKNNQNLPEYSNPNSAKLFSSNNTCVRLDSLSAVERLKLLQFSSCSTFVVHEHNPCSCTMGCGCGDGGSRAWTCNCPGVPTGQLPEIRPQDSTRSSFEFLGETQSECSSVPPTF